MSGAVDAVRIVNCGVVKYKVRREVEEDARGSILLSCGVPVLVRS
jgi:hypothetical protein